MLSVILAAAITTASPVATPAHGAGQTAETKVCHVEPIQGSRITHRVCLTAAEAAFLEREARLLLDHAQAGSQAPNMASMVSMGPMH